MSHLFLWAQITHTLLSLYVLRKSTNLMYIYLLILISEIYSLISKLNIKAYGILETTLQL